MFDKFEVLESWKLSWDLSFLFLGVSDGHIFFDFSNYCPIILADGVSFFRGWGAKDGAGSITTCLGGGTLLRASEAVHQPLLPSVALCLWNVDKTIISLAICRLFQPRQLMGQLDLCSFHRLYCPLGYVDLDHQSKKPTKSKLVTHIPM